MSSHPSPASGGNASQGGLDNIRMIIRRGIYGFTTVVIVCMTFFIWHPWTALQGPGQGGTQSIIQSASDCSGKSRTITLGSANAVINGGAECDMVGWDIDSPVVLVADNGYEETFTYAHAFGFRAARWRAVSGHATVTAVFCRKGKQWDGVDSCY